MAYLIYDPETFAGDAAEGFVAAHRDLVQQVPGGVVRTTRSDHAEVAIVIGGGSGHYPAFGGLVGPGLAHGAVLGNIFASPSAHQVEGVARIADQGRGVLLSYGNYAGDVLQFNAAAARLEDSGIPVRSIPVTDDISSASAQDVGKRRGIAGDLVVFKVAGAAAASGKDLCAVADLAQRANSRTRSIGVAFTGCSLPGADKPLFQVPKGRMAIGLGIHGEPGLEENDVPTPAGLAELLVGKLFADMPSDCDTGSSPVIAILNGLGAFKYEEMFAVFAQIQRMLTERGVEIADAKIGEFCTSFEMSGVSLTLFWPDEELREMWFAPAESAAYTQGQVDSSSQGLSVDVGKSRIPVDDPLTAVTTGSEQSRAIVPVVLDALSALNRTVDESVDELGRIDSIAGDGDHGLGMQRGAHAALAAGQKAAAVGAGAGTVLKTAADFWSDAAGGTSGALWSLMLRSVAQAIGDTNAPTPEAIRRGVAAAHAQVVAQGGAHEGDKTMVDALAPFAITLCANPSEDIVTAWQQAAAAATTGAQETAAMMPRLGRARSHGAKAVGTPDPGAVSFALIVTALSDVLREHSTTISKEQVPVPQL